MIKRIYLLISVFVFVSCGVFKKNIPQPKTEFRGFWVATVVNIDWPKSGDDTIEKQKEDYIKILDFYDNLNFNAAVVQIRTAGDAFYSSKYAPWSRFLTGKEGKATQNEMDILEWMIAETHKRGMEFHAWLNPYRATFDLKTDILSPIHDFNLHPEWMVRYGKKYYYNPGNPEVRDHLVSIMAELVDSYNIDSIHFDDYFYPYKIKDEVFKDSSEYSHYALKNQSLDDWRRSNVDSLVKGIHKTIKSKKPWVQFGVSPFGVWKNKSTDPKGSDTKAGQTTYEDLYADPLLWMEKKWLDYLVPQVYWSMDLPVASHLKIVNWWSKNSKNVNLYIGNGAYRVRNSNDKAWESKMELPKQLKLARKTEAVNGNVFFSAKSLMNNNPDVVKYLKKKFYQYEALPPVSPLASDEKQTVIHHVSTNLSGNSVELEFDHIAQKRYALVYVTGKKTKKDYGMKKLLVKAEVKNGNKILFDRSLIGSRNRFALTFIDKYGRENDAIIVHLNETD